MGFDPAPENHPMVFAFIAAYLVIAAVFYYVVLKTAMEVKETLVQKPVELELVEGGVDEGRRAA